MLPAKQFHDPDSCIGQAANLLFALEYNVDVCVLYLPTQLFWQGVCSLLWLMLQLHTHERLSYACGSLLGNDEQGDVLKLEVAQ